MNSKVVSVLSKQADEGLNAIQEILEGLPHGVALFDCQLVLRQWNRRFIDLLDLEPSFLEGKVHLNDILYLNWSTQKDDKSNFFAAKILYELTKANSADELFPFNYEYCLRKEKTLEIKGEVLAESGLIITFSDISLRTNPNHNLYFPQTAYADYMHEETAIRIIEAQTDREIMERQAAKAVQIADDLAVTREIAENTARHLETIMNAISDVLVTVDIDGYILTCNQAAKSMFGYNVKEILGANLLFLVNTADIISEKDIKKFLSTLSETEKLKIHSGTGYKKSGTTFPVELNIREVTISGQKQYTLVISDVTERYETEMLIRKMALHDSLTGLANRNLLQQRLDEATRMAARMDKKVSVMFLDLDGFKPVNDTYGHTTGDQLLKIVGSRLETSSREIDTVARLGGDEFAIISTNIDKEQDIIHAAQRILDCVQDPILINGTSHQISTSIGVSFFPLDSRDPEELVRMADVALYQAKNDGKSVYRLYDPEMDAQAKSEKQIEIDLKKAIENDELVLHYQPLLDTLDYSIIQGIRRG